jgi:hypothetical protein
MTSIDDLGQRVQQLEDTAAIISLKHRYLNACDEKMPDQVTACFAPGNVDINFGHIGTFSSREDFVKVFVAMGCHEHIVDMHHAQNPIVEILGQDRACAKIALRFYSLNTQDKTSAQLAGHYRDEYQRIDGEWLIVRSHFLVSSVELRDFSGDSSVVTYAGNHMPEL